MILQLIHTKYGDGTEYLISLVPFRLYHLPLNGSPTLEGVTLLPPLEDEAKTLAYEDPTLIDTFFFSEIGSFIKGYNKAKEKYKYTEEDMGNLWQFIVDGAKQILLTGETNVGSFDEYIQSLSQPKLPTQFNTETNQYIY